MGENLVRFCRYLVMYGSIEYRGFVIWFLFLGIRFGYFRIGEEGDRGR